MTVVVPKLQNYKSAIVLRMVLLIFSIIGLCLILRTFHHYGRDIAGILKMAGYAAICLAIPVAVLLAIRAVVHFIIY